MGTWLLPVILALVSGGIAAAGVYVAFNWVHLRYELALEHRLNDLERRLNSQQAILVNYERKKMKNLDSDLLEQIKEEKKPAFDLETWRKAAFSRKI